MPKTTAVLDGDSSKLVDAIEAAKKAMSGMDTTAKKLTDQLRDVADDADRAAGVFIQKLGGPNAIKAAAGIGAAIGGATVALGAFSSSMSAFASTQGEKGQKAMADLDTAINEMQGKLFTAVMGTENLEDAMDTIIGVIHGLTTAFELLLVPVKAFSGLVKDITTDHSSAAVQAREHAKAEKEYSTALESASGQMKSAHEGYASVERSIIGLLGTKREMAIFDLEQTQRDYQAIILQQDRAMQARRLAAGDFAAAQAETTKREELIAAETKRIEEHEARRTKIGKDGIRERTADQIRAMAEARVDNDKAAQQQIDSVRQSAREQSDARLNAQELGFAEERRKLREAQQRIEEEKTKLKNAKEVTPRVTGATTAAGEGEPKAPEETAEGKMFREMREWQEKGAKEQAEADAKAYADGLAAEVAAFRAAETEKAAIAQAAKDKEKADEQAAFDFRKGLAEDLFQVKAKLLVQEMVAGKNGFKVMADMARKAIGNTISALGDKAMAEAAFMAASFNPMAIPMAAAGAAAYAAAAYLGSDAKKATSSTPASAAPVQAAPVNTSFNLRVDAAFADGESIARQFATMQAAAQRRGLVPAGAY